MTTPAELGGDPFTAIHLLLKLFDPYMKTLALLAVFSSQLGVFPSIKDFPVSLASSPALLGAAFLLRAFTKPSAGAATSENAKTSSEEAVKDGTETGAAKTDPLGIYLKAGLIGYLIFHVSWPYSIDLPIPPAIPSWVWAPAAAVMAVVHLILTAKLYGPIRFVCLECIRALFYSHSDWWLYPVILLVVGPALLPDAMAKIGIAGGLVIATAFGVYAYCAYDTQLRVIAKESGRHASVANVALSSAKEYSAAAARYETLLLSNGTMPENPAAPADSMEDAEPQQDRGDKKPDDDEPPKPDAIFEIALAAEETARLAEKAVSSARDGDMAGARQDVADAKMAADKTLSFMEAFRQEMLKLKKQSAGGRA